MKIMTIGIILVVVGWGEELHVKRKINQFNWYFIWVWTDVSYINLL